MTNAKFTKFSCLILAAGLLGAGCKGSRSTHSSQIPVLNGADVLHTRSAILPKGLKVGLITNHTGHNLKRHLTLDLLLKSKNLELRAIFSPEHGLHGTLDRRIGDSTDTNSGLKIFSLYGATRKPTAEQLAGLDALIFDIQDIGCRFYTYISTMGLAMEAASQAGIRFIVLDRINPIGGQIVDGPIRQGPSQFIAFHDIPIQHGMTVGELALMFNKERSYYANLQVVKVEGWSRGKFFDETGQPWTNPSPNMRSLTQAILYPGIGLLETALSVGRGTDTPFEIIGAPYIDDVKLARSLNDLQQPGVRFIPIKFTPKASIHKDRPCRGVNIIITDRKIFRSVPLGIEIARVLHQMYPENFPLSKVNRLLCHSATLKAIEDGDSLSQIQNIWKEDLNQFRKRRAEFLLYK